MVSAEKELVLGLAFSFLAWFHLLFPLVQFPIVSLSHLHHCFAQIQVLQLLNYASLITLLFKYLKWLSLSTEPSPNFLTRPSDLSDQEVSLVAPNLDLIAGHIVLSPQSLSEGNDQSFLFQMWPSPWNLVLSGSFSIFASQTLLLMFIIQSP